MKQQLKKILSRLIIASAVILIFGCTAEQIDRVNPIDPGADNFAGIVEPDNNTDGSNNLTGSLIVTYDGNGHTAGTAPNDTNRYTSGAGVSVLNKGSLVKTGYFFIGWNTKADGTGLNRLPSDAFIIVANVTLYALWSESATYSITFDKNATTATGTTTEQYIVSGASASLNANGFSRPGYTFGGWATTTGGTAIYTNRANYTMGGANVTLFAKWNPNPSYSITFDPNTGTGSMSPQSILSGASANLSTCTFTKVGSAFAGWALTSDGAVAYNNGANYTMGSSDVTLYAKWTVGGYTVTFDSVSGTTPSIVNKAVTYDSAYGTLATTTRAGYTFSGWYTNSGYLGVEITSDSIVKKAANHTLYAKWVVNPSYSITFDPNGGTGSMTSQSIQGGLSATLTANAFTRTGYTFAGWATTSDGAKVYNNSASYTMGSSDVILYAKWTAIASTVTFNGASGAAPSPATKSVTYDSTYGTLAITTRTGYTFAGWYSNVSYLGSEITASTVVKSTANHTLYAKWTVNSYTVSFDSEGGSAESSISVTYGSTYGILPTPTKSGFSFGGWYTGDNGTGTKILSTTSVAITVDQTLYARWEGLYTVTFDKNDDLAEGTMSPQSIGSGSSAALSAIGFTKPGHAFIGWATTPTGSVAYANSASFPMGYSFVTLYAKWSPTYQVTFNSDGGSVPSPLNKMVINTLTYGTLPTVTRAGFVFDGWWTGSGGTGSKIISTTVASLSADQTLFAKWNVNPIYTVFFIADGVTLSTPSRPVTNGLPYGNFEVPVKAGYVFNGWWTGTGGTGTRIVSSATVSLSASQSLHAKFSRTYVQIYTVEYRTLALNMDGTLYTWGHNISGQLGDGTTANKLTPTLIGSGYSQLVVTDVHTIGLKVDGTLYAWGRNYAGQLGDGTLADKSTPTLIGSGYSQVAAINNNTVALKTDGTLYAWGKNDYGQLGDGTLVDKSIPTFIGSGYSQVATGFNNTFALKTDGTLYAWGYNEYGQLGDGTTVNKSTPTLIGNGYSQIVSSGYFTLALKTDGTLYAWGRNNYGQLGDGTTVNKSTPTLIGSGYNKVSIKASSAYAFKTDGTLYGWGYNNYGQLGVGSTANKSTPTLIGSGYSQIAGTGLSTVALKSDGTLYAWGRNYEGQLGDGTLVDKSTPTLIGSGYSQIVPECGDYHTVALKIDGTLYSWGRNDFGQLGIGNTTDKYVPTQVFY